jgi:hypothetical protein
MQSSAEVYLVVYFLKRVLEEHRGVESQSLPSSEVFVHGQVLLVDPFLVFGKMLLHLLALVEVNPSAVEVPVVAIHWEVLASIRFLALGFVAQLLQAFIHPMLVENQAPNHPREDHCV